MFGGESAFKWKGQIKLGSCTHVTWLGFSAFRQFLQKQTQQSIPQQLSSPISIVNWPGSFFANRYQTSKPMDLFLSFSFSYHSWIGPFLALQGSQSKHRNDLFLLSNTFISYLILIFIFITRIFAHINQHTMIELAISSKFNYDFVQRFLDF